MNPLILQQSMERKRQLQEKTKPKLSRFVTDVRRTVGPTGQTGLRINGFDFMISKLSCGDSIWFRVTVPPSIPSFGGLYDIEFQPSLSYPDKPFHFKFHGMRHFPYCANFISYRMVALNSLLLHEPVWKKYNNSNNNNDNNNNNNKNDDDNYNFLLETMIQIIEDCFINCGLSSWDIIHTKDNTMMNININKILFQDSNYDLFIKNIIRHSFATQNDELFSTDKYGLVNGYSNHLIDKLHEIKKLEEITFMTRKEYYFYKHELKKLVCNIYNIPQNIYYIFLGHIGIDSNMLTNENDSKSREKRNQMLKYSKFLENLRNLVETRKQELRLFEINKGKDSLTLFKKKHKDNRNMNNNTALKIPIRIEFQDPFIQYSFENGQHHMRVSSTMTVEILKKRIEMKCLTKSHQFIKKCHCLRKQRIIYHLSLTHNGKRMQYRNKSLQDYNVQSNDVIIADVHRLGHRSNQFLVKPT